MLGFCIVSPFRMMNNRKKVNIILMRGNFPFSHVIKIFMRINVVILAGLKT